MRLTALICAAAFLAAPAARAQEAEGDVAAFFRLRSEGTAAAQADDMATARARLDEADARNPGHPGLTLMRARLALADGRTQDAVALIERYAAYGLIFDPAADRSLAPLAGTPELAAVEARLARNREPVGADRMTALFTVGGAGLTEAVVRDPSHDRWLVSQVADRALLAVDDAGVATPFLRAPPQTAGVLGLAVDDERGVVWAATAPLPPARAGWVAANRMPDTALIRIGQESGVIEAWFDPPARDGERAFGDVALGPDGAVYVSDSVAGEVLVLRPAGQRLEVLLPPGAVGSPQGIAVSPDGRSLVVADYPSGLWRVDAATGAAVRIPTPDGASLIGVDGLTAHDGALIAIQNGTAPQRVLRLDLSSDWTTIERIEVLAANLPEIDEPTTGVVLDGALVFVARSQWSDFDGEGRPRSQDMAPARIMRLSLD